VKFKSAYSNTTAPKQTTTTVNWNSVTNVYDIKVALTTLDEFKKTIEAIKIVPTLSRTYNEDTKIWSISENFLPILETTFKHLGIKYTKLEKPKFTPPFMQGTTLSEQDKYIVSFFKLLSYEAAAKAFKFGMVALHPDSRGGNADEAAALSEAWAWLEKNFFKK
jgi:hypothetical protein